MNNLKKIGIAVGGVVIVLAVLYYFQSQGLVKIFPSSEERNIKKILEIDETQFVPAQGLSEEDFQAKIAELYEWKETVLEDPTNVNSWMRFGNVKEFLNDHAGAIEAWKKVVELQPPNFVALNNIATNYQYFLKNYPEAEKYYLLAIQANGGYTSAYQGLMDLYHFNYKEKQDLYEPIVLMAIANDSSNAPSYYSALVRFFARNGNFEKAREYMPQLTELKPEAAADFQEEFPKLR